MLAILTAIVAGLIVIATGANAPIVALWALGALVVGFIIDMIVAIFWSRS